MSNRIFSTIYTCNHLKNIGNCGTKIAPTTRAKQEQPTIQQEQKQAPKKNNQRTRDDFSTANRLTLADIRQTTPQHLPTFFQKSNNQLPPSAMGSQNAERVHWQVSQHSKQDDTNQNTDDRSRRKASFIK
ncbi:MAG: hypothetical protein AB7D06_09680 [Pedobacter sp.]